MCIGVWVCLVLSSMCSIRFFWSPAWLQRFPPSLFLPHSSHSLLSVLLCFFFCFVAKHFSQFYKLKQEGSLVMPLSYHHRLLLHTMQTKLLFCCRNTFFSVYKLTLNYLGSRTQLLRLCSNLILGFLCVWMFFFFSFFFLHFNSFYSHAFCSALCGSMKRVILVFVFCFFKFTLRLRFCLLEK